MTAPPIQPPPAFDVPGPTMPRHIGGWVLLAAMFTLMIGQNLALYLDRGAEKKASYGSELQSLRYSVEMKQAFRNLGMPDSGEMDRSLQSIVRKFDDKAKADPQAAKIIAAIQSEAKQKIDPLALATLANSKEPKNKALARAFDAKTLSKEEANSLIGKIKGKDFINRLAIVHAMEKSGQGQKAREELIPKSKALAKMGAILAIVGALIIAIALLTGYGIFKAIGKVPSVGFPLAKISPADADRLALRCAQIFAFFLAVQIVAAYIGGAFDKNWLTLFIYLTLIFVTLALFRYPIGGKVFSLREIGISGENLGKNIAWGVGAAIANLPIVFLMAMIGTKLFAGLPPAEHPITVQLQSGVNWFGLAVIFFSASIGAPILEEIMFRGTLLPALARVWGRPVLAILVQGLIFAAIHPTGVPAWLPLATIGAMSGFLCRQTGSLVPSMVMHGVHNFGTLLFALTLFG